MRGNDTLDMRVRFKPAALIVAAVFLVAAFALAQLPPIGRRPVFGYMSSFAIVIGAAFTGAGDHVRPGAARAATLRRRFGVEGLLAHANLTSAIPRLSISVAALAVSLSMMVAIAVMIGSFRDTVVYWVGQTLQGRPLHRPRHPPTVGSEQTVSEDVIATLARIRRSRSLDRFRNVDLVFEGNLAVLGGGIIRRRAVTAALLFKGPENARERCAEPSARTGGDFGAIRHPLPHATATRCSPTPAGVRHFGSRRSLRLRRRSRRRHHGPRRLREILWRAAADGASRPT